jgi:hypothetical protein
MEPKKKLKKFNEFKTKKKNEFVPLDINYVANEPMRQYRYMMEFPLGDTMFNCFVNCELPSASIRRGHLGFGVGEFLSDYQPQWQPIQVVIRDVIGDETHRNLFYSRIRDWFNDYNITGRKINSTISRLDPTGVVISRWDLRGCFCSSLHYSNTYLDFEQPELEITLHYDYCTIVM